MASSTLMIGLFVFLPFLWLTSLREQAEAYKAEYDLIVARSARLAGDRRIRLTESDAPQRMYFEGGTTGTTFATLQSFVNSAALDSGLNVLRIQPLPTGEEGVLKPYRLSVDAAGSLEQLRSFFVKMEAALPVVIVRGFEMTPRAAFSASEMPYPSEDLAVTVKIEAFSVGAAK